MTVDHHYKEIIRNKTVYIIATNHVELDYGS